MPRAGQGRPTQAGTHGRKGSPDRQMLMCQSDSPLFEIEALAEGRTADDPYGVGQAKLRSTACEL